MAATRIEVPIPPQDLQKAKDRPKLTIEDQIKHMRDTKGIKFNIVNEEQAAEFLSTHNYYFKVKAYAKNYSTYAKGENEGKYVDLEFAYIQELSKLDMFLREVILSMALDIEHFLKVRLIRDISDNSEDDGYSSVEEFLTWHPNVKAEIAQKAKDSYCEPVIQKYQEHFPVWAFVEVLSFGDLINFCDYYYANYPAKDISISTLRIVKFLRNACAHNNCLINNLSGDNDTFTLSKNIFTLSTHIPNISTKTRMKKMSNRTIHDFVALLFCFDSIVTNKNAKKRQLLKLQKLFDGRFLKHKDYFSSNSLLCSSYDFVKKVIDFFVSKCV
jgi:abortive infection bacteriophage resistance protein